MVKVENTKSNRKKCICINCPSYPQKCDGELLYCSQGKSCADIHENGCICYMCPVYFENKLEGLYYCDKEIVGESKTLMRKKKSDESKSFYQSLVDIKDISILGESVVRSMGSTKKMPFDWQDLHLIPAQVYKTPLNQDANVKTEIVIGPQAKKPLILSSPILISGLSFGAVSRKVRTIIAHVAADLGIGFNTGEGGILDEEIETASDYLIMQYSTGRFGIDEQKFKMAAAVELRFGQGAYPGKGSYLPASKITPEIAEIRGLKYGEAAYSPARHSDILSPSDIKQKVVELRKITSGVPIGAKIGCGNIEKDLEVLVDAEVDFIAIDGFGGGTGATNIYVRENVGIPLIVALPRALKTLNEMGVEEEISLIAGGGLRTSPDFIKCLAMGANAVYIGTSALIAINCDQFRICHTGKCPTGITTQSPSLLKQLDIEDGIKKLSNFIRVSNKELESFIQIVGKNDLSEINKNDLISLNRDLAHITGIKWLDGKNY
ncbi:MAG: glutamate synthase-related protein [Methanobacteriaceae archaeon]|nr:glutamate synthase-related protein [Methanobacteriaceae archaeon]